MQLLSPSIKLLRLIRSNQHDARKLYTLDDFKADHEEISNPNLWADFLALQGDASDNVPGVRGIGEKTAKALVKALGSVENILDNINEAPVSFAMSLHVHTGGSITSLC